MGHAGTAAEACIALGLQLAMFRGESRRARVAAGKSLLDLWRGALYPVPVGSVTFPGESQAPTLSESDCPQHEDDDEEYELGR